MGPMDALSRKDDVDTDDDNREITLLGKADQYFHVNALNAALATKIAQSSTHDPIVSRALEAMNSDQGEPWIPCTLKANWHFEEGKLYFKGRLYIPESNRHDLIKSLHESPCGGHEGFYCTLHCVQRDYWWPGMSTFLHKYISGCAMCQQAKVNTHPTVPGLTPLSVQTPIPFSSISVDLITSLPVSHGFDSVMVVVDHGLTKGVIYCPCSKNIDTAGVAQLFFKHVFPRFGLHQKIISDRGPQFASAFTREIAQLLQYDVALSTAYHPQTDGETERVNQELETYLRIFSANQPKEWSEMLPMAEFAHNSATHSITNKTLFSLMMGYKPQAYPSMGKTFLPNLEGRLLELSAT